MKNFNVDAKATGLIIMHIIITIGPNSCFHVNCFLVPSCYNKWKQYENSLWNVILKFALPLNCSCDKGPQKLMLLKLCDRKHVEFHIYGIMWQKPILYHDKNQLLPIKKSVWQVLICSSNTSEKVWRKRHSNW